MANPNLLRAVIKCRSILSPPDIYQRVCERADDPSTSNRQLAGIVQADPGVASRLLAIVNSALYGFPRQIDSIPQAITIVGLIEFKQLVLTTSLIEAFGNAKLAHFSLSDFWMRSVRAGMLAHLLGQLLEQKEQCGAFFTAGLLLKLGRFISANEGQDYIEVLEECWARCDYRSEREILGFDHAEAGAELLTKWQMPERIIIATARQNRMPRAEDSSTVKAAFLANFLLSYSAERVRLQLPLILARIGCKALTPERLEELHQRAIEEVDQLRRLYA